mmetsp:Transcript_18181/g.32585  ORF Transcript_18181/g.32585 Transcript_18181/m.32585 type:complete len:200 (-) Transcript_18181:1586-2185(-)
MHSLALSLYSSTLAMSAKIVITSSRTESCFVAKSLLKRSRTDHTMQGGGRGCNETMTDRKWMRLLRCTRSIRALSAMLLMMTSTTPDSTIWFLIITQSPTIFPRPLTAISATSGLDEIKAARPEITPSWTSLRLISADVHARLVTHQAASNCTFLFELRMRLTSFLLSLGIKAMQLALKCTAFSHDRTLRKVTRAENSL